MIINLAKTVAHEPLGLYKIPVPFDDPGVADRAVEQVYMPSLTARKAFAQNSALLRTEGSHIVTTARRGTWTQNWQWPFGDTKANSMFRFQSLPFVMP